jgi:hypothetical protein
MTPEEIMQLEAMESI